MIFFKWTKGDLFADPGGKSRFWERFPKIKKCPIAPKQQDKVLSEFEDTNYDAFNIVFLHEIVKKEEWLPFLNGTEKSQAS